MAEYPPLPGYELTYGVGEYPMPMPMPMPPESSHPLTNEADPNSSLFTTIRERASSTSSSDSSSSSSTDSTKNLEKKAFDQLKGKLQRFLLNCSVIFM